jgi:hypothetical protein
VQDEAEVRREAWYDGRWLWAKVVEGEGGAEMVGEDEVSIARHRLEQQRVAQVWWQTGTSARFSVPA